MRISPHPIRRAMIGLLAVVAAGTGVMAVPVATAQAGPLPRQALPTISLPPPTTLPGNPGIIVPPLVCQNRRNWLEGYEGGILHTGVPMRRHATLFSDPGLELYCVHVAVTISHPQRSELRVELVEPNGVLHTLHAPGASSGADYTFRHIVRGISSSGNFTLMVTDTVAGNTGNLVRWRFEGYYR